MNVGFLYLCDGCNMRCKHCHVSAAMGRGAEMSMTVLRQALELFSSIGVEQVRLTGGEPTLHRDFCSIVETIEQAGFSQGIATNGLLLMHNAHIRDVVLRSIARIWISVYGITALGHDGIRDSSGMPLDDLVLGIAELAAQQRNTTRNATLGISAVVSRHELEHVPAFLARISDLGIRRVRIIPLQYDGRGRSLDTFDSDSFLSEYGEQIRVCRSDWVGRFDELRFNDPGDATRRHSNVEGSCLLGERRLLAVVPSGQIYPCCFLVYDEAHMLGHVSDGVAAVESRGLSEITRACKGLHGSIWPGVTRTTYCPISYVTIT